MNALINTYSDPKLLTDSALPLLVVLSGSRPLESRHGLESLPICTFENIQARADLVTPTLRDILNNSPTEHWGINE